MDVGLGMLTYKEYVSFSPSCPFLAEPLQGIDNYTKNLHFHKTCQCCLWTSPVVKSYNG